VDREQNRVLDLDRSRRLDAAREILLRRRGVDAPRLAGEILLDAAALELVVVLHADEAPLQAGEAIVGGAAGQLRAGLHRRQHREPAEREAAPRPPHFSTSFSSRPWARS